MNGFSVRFLFCNNQPNRPVMTFKFFALTILLGHVAAACTGDKCVTPTMVVTLPAEAPQHTPIVGDVEKKEGCAPTCGCCGEEKCGCWTKATMIDELPEPVKEEAPAKEETTDEVPVKEAPCEGKKPCQEPWQKPKMVQKLLPELKECDCKSKTIVPAKCGCEKLKTKCGCQTCPCLKAEGKRNLSCFIYSCFPLIFFFPNRRFLFPPSPQIRRTQTQTLSKKTICHATTPVSVVCVRGPPYR